MYDFEDEKQKNPYGKIDLDEEEMKPNDENQIHKTLTPLEKFQKLPENTLDEGICDSLINQIKAVCLKFSYVLIPKSDPEKEKKLKNWDLWGPFFLALLFALFIDSSSHFMAVLFSIFIGAMVVTFNLRVLGAQVSLFEAVSILGYCICPLFISLLLVEFLRMLKVKNQLVIIILVSLAVVWCVFAAKTFVGINVPENKKFVALYPIILFYAFIGVMLVYHK